MKKLIKWLWDEFESIQYIMKKKEKEIWERDKVRETK